jgi:integrase
MPHQVAILEGDEPGLLLDHAPAAYRFEFLACTELRIGDTLGSAGRTSTRGRADPRPPPALPQARAHPAQDRGGKARGDPRPRARKGAARTLAGKPRKAPSDLVFCNTLGRGLDYRDVGEGFRQAVKRAGLQAPGKLTLHSLQHTFASLLIAKGLNVVFVSRQLGHANRNVTLGVYAHLCSSVPTTRMRRGRR